MYPTIIQDILWLSSAVLAIRTLLLSQQDFSPSENASSVQSTTVLSMRKPSHSFIWFSSDAYFQSRLFLINSPNKEFEGVIPLCPLKHFSGYASGVVSKGLYNK